MRALRRLRRELDTRRLEAATARTLRPPAPERFARFGAGSVIVPPTRVYGAGNIAIGDRVTIHELAYIAAVPGPDGTDPRLVIGDRTVLQPMITIACVGSVEIGADVLFAAGTFIGDASHAFDDPTRPILDQGMTPPRPVVVGDGAFVGIRCVLLPGSSIGAGAFVGAGSVVSGDVPPHTVAAGNPARVIRRYVEGEGWVRA